MEKQKNNWRSLISSNSIVLGSIGIFLLCSSFAIVISYFLYQYTRVTLEERLKERLISIVNTASIQFLPEDILRIKESDDYQTDSYTRVVRQLQLIRNYNENIEFAYILSPTDRQNEMLFVADADSLDPTAEVDLNGDGQINEDDALAFPGDTYDVTEIPALQKAIDYPTTDSDPVEDQWGIYLSSYAPIKYKGETVAILGVDVEVSDYLERISVTFFPFAAFVAFLLILLGMLTISVVRLWYAQVRVLSEIDRQKDELLSIVSHQLAAPITSIKWYLELLLGGDVGRISKEQSEYLQSMESISVDLADLVSMILDVSRIQLGKLKVDLVKNDIEEFYSQIFNVIKPRAAEKKIDLKIKFNLNQKYGNFDKRLTRMAVENLLTNAIKYSDNDGKVYFEVTANSGFMKIMVKDDGVGIPKKEQKEIFGKLFRASNVRGTIDGNGFGLYISKGGIEAQGGKIWFESLERHGTTFYISLPI